MTKVISSVEFAQLVLTLENNGGQTNLSVPPSIKGFFRKLAFWKKPVPTPTGVASVWAALMALPLSVKIAVGTAVVIVPVGVAYFYAKRVQLRKELEQEAWDLHLKEMEEAVEEAVASSLEGMGSRVAEATAKDQEELVQKMDESLKGIRQRMAEASPEDREILDQKMEEAARKANKAAAALDAAAEKKRKAQSA